MSRYTGPPMDLANMRSLGVTKVDVYCACGHQASVDVSDLPGDLAVRDVRFRLRCSKCGNRPTETRPDWSRYKARGRLQGSNQPGRKLTERCQNQLILSLPQPICSTISVTRLKC
jgi:hypothetical protein